MKHIVDVPGPNLDYPTVLRINQELLSYLNSSEDKVDLVVNLIAVMTYSGGSSLTPILDGLAIARHPKTKSVTIVVNRSSQMMKLMAGALKRFGAKVYDSEEEALASVA